LTQIECLKVVIIGQDPYPQPGYAMGLAFSVLKGIKIPSSLKNIFKNIKNDPKITNFKKPKHGDLTKWAKQGVLLLNTSLTVEDSKPDSHRKAGWDHFTDEVIVAINKNCEKIVFLLWGDQAQKKGRRVNESKHYVLKTSHPTEKAADKGFATTKFFSKVNDILKSNGKSEIDWSLDQEE